ncbi:MAG: formylglycine-generating enzyme family protein [Candidatus Poribacteria bacterium]|nr:formylglycine-generating enzyme family protein [Candidatus Poribacteria bacterium]
MKSFCIIICLLMLVLSQQIVSAQQSLATEPTEEAAEGFIKLEMPLEEAFTKITFVVTWLSGDGSDEVIFEGEGVIRTPDYIELRIPYEDDSGRYSYYRILPKDVVESNRYIFVPLADSGGGSGVFWELQVVDKKTLRTVDYIGLGDRARLKEIVLADASTNTISIIYSPREVPGHKGLYPKKAIKRHFRIVEGIAREVGDPSNPSAHNMMFIPAGYFEMGGINRDEDAERDEKPTHTVSVDAFYIDTYEVTNGQYKEFVDANPQWQKGRIPKEYHDGDYLKHWDGNDYPPDKGDHPVVYVSWYAAMAYAQWQRKRLPTEAEWEKAARGNLFKKKYAWGASLDADKANYGERVSGTTAVGTYPANGYGLYDMTGNVWEWCLDEYNADFYSVSPCHNPIAGGTVDTIVSDWMNVKSVRVLRGGSWVSDTKFVRVSDRTRFTPKITNKARGFRCVKPVTY